MDQKPQSPFTVWFQQPIVKIIYNAFSYMSENYHMTGVIDHAAWIIQEEELGNLIPKFIPNEQAVRCISFSANAYNQFVRLIDYAGYAAPKQEDRELLELIHECFLDSESGNNKIYNLMTFDPDNLAAVVSVFDQIIEDPGAIDHSLYDLSPWPEFVTLTNRLTNLQTTSDSQIFVPMTFGEWATYSSYLNRAGDLDSENLSLEDINGIANLVAENSLILTYLAKSDR